MQRLVLLWMAFAAAVWGCRASGGPPLLGEGSVVAPPPPASREGAAAAGPSVLAAASPTGAASVVLPELLSATGLYASASSTKPHPDVIQFVPQYPLWSDGATKKRYLRLPPGTVIDGSKPDAWVFPIGTRLWKEFSFAAPASGAAAPDAGTPGADASRSGASASNAGLPSAGLPNAGALRRVETRYLERRADGSWAFASYIWDASGQTARLAPEGGVRGVATIGESGLSHDVPSREDCLACHEGVGERAPVLGFSALQLSGARDGRAPHAEALPGGALDLEQLLARGLLAGYPKGLARPGIHAETPEARATLGYLHANCAGCHNRQGPLADLELDFEQTVAEPDSSARVLASLVSVPARFQLPGHEHSLRVAPGEPAESVLGFRIGSRHLAQQMPPLGSKLVDQEATALVVAWIAQMKVTPSHDGNENAASHDARKEDP